MELDFETRRALKQLVSDRLRERIPAMRASERNPFVKAADGDPELALVLAIGARNRPALWVRANRPTRQAA